MFQDVGEAVVGSPKGDPACGKGGALTGGSSKGLGSFGGAVFCNQKAPGSVGVAGSTAFGIGDGTGAAPKPAGCCGWAMTNGEALVVAAAAVRKGLAPSAGGGTGGGLGGAGFKALANGSGGAACPKGDGAAPLVEEVTA